MIFIRYKYNFRIIRGKKEDFFNSKYIFYSILLKKIAQYNKEIARDIHEDIYKRAFLFSNFIFNKKNKKFFSVYISTPYKEVERELLRIIASPIFEFRNGNEHVIFELLGISQQMIEYEKIQKLNFLSPINIRDKGGKSKITQNISYNKIIEAEIIRTVESIAKKIGKEVGDFKVEVAGEFREKNYRFQDDLGKQIIVKALEAKTKTNHIEIEGDKAAKEIILNYGIGDRTKLGFGMVGVLLGE